MTNELQEILVKNQANTIGSLHFQNAVLAAERQVLENERDRLKARIQELEDKPEDSGAAGDDN